MTLAYDMYMVAKEAAEVAAEKAFENGFSAGEERGRNEGAQQKAIETAKNLLSIGLSQKQIASVTGLSIEEIEKL